MLKLGVRFRLFIWSGWCFLGRSLVRVMWWIIISVWCVGFCLKLLGGFCYCCVVWMVWVRFVFFRSIMVLVWVMLCMWCFCSRRVVVRIMFILMMCGVCCNWCR